MTRYALASKPQNEQVRFDQLGDAQSRRKRTSTHEWHHKWTHEWTHEIAHESATTGPTRVLCFQPFKDSHKSSHETSHECVHGSAHEKRPVKWSRFTCPAFTCSVRRPSIPIVVNNLKNLNFSRLLGPLPSRLPVLHEIASLTLPTQLSALGLGLSSGKKKEPKPKLFGPDIFGWGGGLPREGVGTKRFGVSFLRSPVKPNCLAGYPGILAGICQVCLNILRKTSLCSIFGLCVLKHRVPKTLAFASGLRLRSETRHSETRVLGRRVPNGKSQKRLRFRDLGDETLAFKNRIAVIPLDLEASLGLALGPLRSKENAAF